MNKHECIATSLRLVWRPVNGRRSSIHQANGFVALLFILLHQDICTSVYIVTASLANNLAIWHWCSADTIRAAAKDVEFRFQRLTSIPLESSPIFYIVSFSNNTRRRRRRRRRRRQDFEHCARICTVIRLTLAKHPLLKRINFFQIRPTDSTFSKETANTWFRRMKRNKIRRTTCKRDFEEIPIGRDGEEENGNLNNILRMIYIGRTYRS